MFTFVLLFNVGQHKKTNKMSKVKCYSVRLESMVSISEKCFKATAFDGSTALIPKSQVFGQDYDVQKSEAWWISAWILEQKDIQYSTKKVSFFDKDRAEFVPETGVEIERHIPEEKECVEVEPIAELVKEEELMPKMKRLVSEGKTKTLTLELAKELKGKRIQTIYFGYRGQDGVDDFIVGDIVLQHTLFGNQDPEFQKEAAIKYANEFELLTAEGKPTYIRTTKFTNEFHCSDSDRLVQFIEA